MDTDKTHNRGVETTEEQAATAGRKAREYRSLAAEPYQGPQEISAMAGRGALLGGIAYVIGKSLGDLGDRPRESLGRFGRSKYVGLAARFWELAFVTGAAIVGMYSASKEVRRAKLQHLKMQREYTSLAHEHMATQQTLESVIETKERTQIKAPEVADKAEERAPDAPQTEVSASELQHHKEPLQHPHLLLS